MLEMIGSQRRVNCGHTASHCERIPKMLWKGGTIGVHGLRDLSPWLLTEYFWTWDNWEQSHPCLSMIKKEEKRRQKRTHPAWDLLMADFALTIRAHLLYHH